MFDLISIGDAVIDTYVPLIDAEVTLDQGMRKLCLRFGDKVPVGPSVAMVAGNAANNAVGASLLKMKTAYYTNVGNDPDGQKIKQHLKEAGVDTRYFAIDAHLQTNRHTILGFKGERTILTYHQPWKYNLPDLDPTRWLYLTSLAASFVESGIVGQIVNYLERTGAKLVFNPGTFQIKMGVKKSPRLLSLCEVMIVNKTEAKLILGFEEGQTVPIKKLLKSLHDLGPKLVVITDGQAGSYGYDGAKYFQLGVFPAKLVEMTGSGDAYATGVVAGLFHGQTLDQAMRWGAANGAAVVEEVGPQAGLLSYSKMQERLKEHPRIITKVI